MRFSLHRYLYSLAVGYSLLTLGHAYAIDSKNTPRPIPLTRPEMKQYLEDMKARKPRIPLPELTDDDKAKLGDRGNSYESRLRYHYLPAQDSTALPPSTSPNNSSPTANPRGSGASGFGGFGFAGGSREGDSDQTLDYKFKTQLFWIVSRTNNCQYCLGHQESKLLAAGMVEDEIAALDSDWSLFDAPHRVAFAYARKLTYEPHRIIDADIEGLRKHFTDKQILEMTLSISGNNAINRWKEGAGIPQSSGGGNFGSRRPGETAPSRPAADSTHHSYLTETAPKFSNVVTTVAPVAADPTTGKPTRTTRAKRPQLESQSETKAALQAAGKRSPRLPLASEDKCRELLTDEVVKAIGSGPVPAWVALLATFPNSAKGRIAMAQAAETKGDLTPLLKAQVAWIIARQDRAWYAAGQARRQLNSLGWTDNQVFQLDGDWAAFTPAERAAFTLARNLAATPVVLTDDEVDDAVKQLGPRNTTQLISYTTHRASFNRVTEAAGLRIE